MAKQWDLVSGRDLQDSHVRQSPLSEYLPDTAAIYFWRRALRVPRRALSSHKAFAQWLDIAMQVPIAKIADQRIDKLMKQLHSRDPRMRNDVEFVHDVPALVHLRLLPEVLDCMEDLRAHLVVSPYQDVFLTSDNPAFRYNQLYEGVQHMGTTGFAVTGLQIFLPLSPRHQLVVYDGTTYKLRWRDRILGVTIATSTDVDTFNGIQLVAADANVYFSDGDQIEDIQRLLPRYRTLRNSDPTVVVEYGQDDDTNSSLVHTYDVTPNLELKLTFLKAKRTASHNGRFKRRGSARDQGSTRWPTHSDVFSVSRAPVKEGG